MSSNRYEFNDSTTLPEPFDPSQHEGNNFQPLPLGEYTLEIIEASVNEARNGSGYRANFTLRVLEGEFENRLVWYGITLTNPSTQAVEIGKKCMKDLCTACGITTEVKDLKVFEFVPFRARIGIEKDKTGVYGDRNKISRTMPLESAGSAATAKVAGPASPGKPQSLETIGRPASSLISMATGIGKSLIIGEVTRRAVQLGRQRVLIATHVRELIEQDVGALQALWPDASYGICSAGLDRRDHDNPILFGTIQTLSRDVEALGRFALVAVDEVHLMSRDDDSMYLRLLAALREKNPDLRLVGLSATCYRLDSGYLDRGDGALFEKTVFDYGIGEAIRDGWLCPIISKATAARIDVDGVGRRGGEFIAGELERACNVRSIVEHAVSEIVARGADRTHWLCFCAGIGHAIAVAGSIRQYGIRAETVTADTPSEERREIFEAFCNGAIRCLTGVNVSASDSIFRKSI